MANSKKITLKFQATGTPAALKILLVMITGITHRIYRFRADIRVEGSNGKKKVLKTVPDPFKQADDIIKSCSGSKNEHRRD